jgi:hypothetical protein
MKSETANGRNATRGDKEIKTEENKPQMDTNRRE